MIREHPVVRSIALAVFIAGADVRSRYARSVLGSFWITLQQALFVGVAGLVFPAVLGVDVTSYMPYFAVSFLFWTFMSSTILENMDALVANGWMIKDRGFSPLVFLFSTLFRNAMISAHALIVPVALILWYGASSPTGFLLAFPGMLLFIITTGAIALSLGILATRFRDLKRICESSVQLAFLVTPILWQAEFAKGRAVFVVDYNPLAHLFIAWRQPLLNGDFSGKAFLVSLAITVISCIFAYLSCRMIPRIAFWI